MLAPIVGIATKYLNRKSNKSNKIVFYNSREVSDDDIFYICANIFDNLVSKGIDPFSMEDTWETFVEIGDGILTLLGLPKDMEIGLMPDTSQIKYYWDNFLENEQRSYRG